MNKYGVIDLDSVQSLDPEYELNIRLQNEYFEKMNSSGKQLEPHEILKVRICQNENEIEGHEADDQKCKFILVVF